MINGKLVVLQEEPASASEPPRILLRKMSDGPSPEAQAAFAKHRKEREEFQRALPSIRKEGEAALRRLLPITQGHSGQCRYVAAFLLGLYNGRRFPFDLTDLRCLDRAIFDDCMLVLRMDYAPAREVHTYFDNGGDEGHKIFEGLAKSWGIKDHLAGTGAF
jgi:hypothetical protein